MTRVTRPARLLKPSGAAPTDSSGGRPADSGDGAAGIPDRPPNEPNPALNGPAASGSPKNSGRSVGRGLGGAAVLLAPVLGAGELVVGGGCVEGDGMADRGRGPVLVPFSAGGRSGDREKSLSAVAVLLFGAICLNSF